MFGSIERQLRELVVKTANELEAAKQELQQSHNRRHALHTHTHPDLGITSPIRFFTSMALRTPGVFSHFALVNRAQGLAYFL